MVAIDPFAGCGVRVGSAAPLAPRLTRNLGNGRSRELRGGRWSEGGMAPLGDQEAVTGPPPDLPPTRVCVMVVSRGHRALIITKASFCLTS